MFIVHRLVSSGGVSVPQQQQCTSLFLFVRTFSNCSRRRAVKKHSPYSSVDIGRYSSLVKSIMSSRVSAQTPESLQREDEDLYGPVVKGQTSSTGGSDLKVPKTFHPFLNCERTTDTEDSESEPPAHILLNRGRSAPSVTRILQATLSPEQIFYLERWKRRMIADLGEEGFKQYSQNLFRQGKLFHSALEDALKSGGTWKGNPTVVSQYPTEVQGYMESISHILDEISAVRVIESAVQHDKLNYLGIVDCVARYRGVLCVIDWKTSEKEKPFLRNTFDNPLQVAAYAGALNNDGNYKYQVENGLIVVAYKNGSPAHAHQMNSELMSEYWDKWLVRFNDFLEQKSSQSSTTVSEKTG